MEPDDSPDTSRPSSPAQSDATEVPDFQRGPRSLVNDIEHIKSIISRTDGVGRAAESSITAQVFRGRAGSIGSAAPVSQQRLFHELDLLKKRIRNEHHHVRRPSQIDPETESESDADDDGQEDELDNIREQLLHERRQSEDLLAGAESRVDALIKEKDDLARLLDTNNHDLARLREEVQAFTAKERQLQEMVDEKSLQLSEATTHAYRMFDESEKSHSASLREMQDQHEEELGKQRAAHTAELSDLRASSQAIDALKVELASAVEACAAAKASWTEDVARLKANHEQTLRELEEGWSSKAEAAARSHHAELSSAQNEYQKKLSELRTDSAQRSLDLNNQAAISTSDPNVELRSQLEASRKAFEAVKAKLTSAQQTNCSQLIQFQEKHKQAVSVHTAEKDGLEREHRHQLDDLEAQNIALERQVNELKSLHRELTRPGRPVSDSNPSENTKGLGFLRECARQLEKVHAFEVERMQNGYDTSLRDLDESSAAELKGVRQALEEALEFARAEGVVALDSTHRDQEEIQHALEQKMLAAEKAAKTQLADLDAQHQKVLQRLELSRQEDMESLRSEHERGVRMLLRNHKSELNSVEESHQQQLSNLEAVLQAQKASDNGTSRASLSKRHQELLERAIAEAHESSQAEIISLKKSHKRELSRVQAAADKELAVALANADEDLEERLRLQSNAHRKELDTLNEGLSIELTHLHLKLEEASQMREEKMQEAESQHRAALEELREKFEVAEQTRTALQARLEAEATGRAEAERSLATLRKQKYSETPTESKALLRRSIIVLEAERDNLARQLAGSPASTYSDAQEIPSSPEEETGDTAQLKQRLANAERERDEAQHTAERRIDEMSRQSEFLVKELEIVMAQRSAEQASYNPNADAAVQTEPVAIIDPRMLQEPKADVAMSKAAKMQRPDLRRSITDVADVQDKRKSFEDYLQEAQAEITDLGAPTDLNETLFAEKTKEHAGVQQTAREQLSVEYQRKFRAIQAEKERMERAVSAKSAADFTKEHVALFASYGIDHDERAKQAAMFHNLPARKKKAIRVAEQGLVAEYHQRLTKRKSQIAMKHAEKFQSLTREFHQKTADLLSGTEVSNDVVGSVTTDQERVQDVINTNEVSSVPLNKATVDKAQLEKAVGAACSTSRKSHLPQRISISMPRTATSIPRAVPFTGKTGWDLAPVSQRSTVSSEAMRLMLDEKPHRPGVDATFATEAASRTSDGLLSESNGSPRAGEGSRNRVASTEDRPPSSSSPSTTSTRSRPRTMKHSSRMIFGAQNA